jgi:hypothetical protein
MSNDATLLGTECPTRYRTRHFFNNSSTNENTATKFVQEYVLFFHISYTMRYVRFKFRCSILISGKMIKEMPGLLASGTPCRSVRVGKLNRLASRKSVIFIHSGENLKSQTTKTIYAVGLISKN